MATQNYIALDQEAVDNFEAFKAANPQMMPVNGADVIAVYYETGGYFVIWEELLNAPAFATLRQGLQDVGYLDNLTIVELDPDTLYPDEPE